jgi:hypothetical protein
VNQSLPVALRTRGACEKQLNPYAVALEAIAGLATLVNVCVFKRGNMSSGESTSRARTVMSALALLSMR